MNLKRKKFLSLFSREQVLKWVRAVFSAVRPKNHYFTRDFVNEPDLTQEMPEKRRQQGVKGGMMTTKSSPCDVNDIANWFLARAKDENRPLRPMKLQKLAYFAYGMYFAYFDQPLFHETIYAFRHGPVVQELFERFRHLQGNPIMEKVVQKSGNIDAGIELLLDSVWKAYEPYSDIQLSDITHIHPPWIDAYNSEEWFAIMSPESIRDHFKKLIEKQSNARP